METGHTLRAWCVTFGNIVEALRPDLQHALKSLRCGYMPRWYRVIETLTWLSQWAEVLHGTAEMEIMSLNTQREEPLEVYHKPRFHKKKAPPRPPRISLSDQETYLEGLLRWLDAMKAAAEAPPGQCRPEMPPGLKAVLQRNGYDPHNWRSPRRLGREYFRG
jgi:hypothetical protein